MAKKSGVKDVGKQALERAIKRLTSMGDQQVTIGIHAEKGAQPYSRGQSTPVTTAMIGTFHEFGTLARFEKKSDPNTTTMPGVPQRSFLRSTVDANRTPYQGLIKRAAIAIIDGRHLPSVAWGLVGEKVVGDVQQRMADGIKPALTAATIEAKGSSKPLIDTGQLRQSITWEYKGS